MRAGGGVQRHEEQGGEEGQLEDEQGCHIAGIAEHEDGDGDAEVGRVGQGRAHGGDEGFRQGPLEREAHDAKEQDRRDHRPDCRHEQRRGKDVVEFRLAEGLEQQGGAGHKKRQGAQDGAGVLAQDIAPANEHADQDDGPDDEESRQYP